MNFMKFGVEIALLAICVGAISLPLPVFAGGGVPVSLVDESILGALRFLDDTQIRDRSGRQSCSIDASHEGEGCSGKINYSTLLSGKNVELPLFLNVVEVRNRPGEWSSFVHALPGKTLRQGKAPLSIQDSSLFVPAFVSYPMFFIIDGEEPVVDPMLDLAMSNIKGYKRGHAYNFWPLLPQETCPPFAVTGPVNIPLATTEAAGKALISPMTGFLFNIFGKELVKNVKPWIKKCLLEESNQTGSAAFFNIPNDADDSSVAAASRLLYSIRRGIPRDVDDEKTLRLFPLFRDLDRTMEDGRDSYKGSNSGAFLTWLKDETADTFSTPNTGVIPLGVNNVDAVVNSNVLFSLTVNGMTDLPGYEEATRLLVNVINLHAWPDAGLYYPQQMIFPYSVTRAFRDGGARTPELREAMKVLLKDILEAQDMTDGEHIGTGSFDGGMDKTFHLSTALAVTSLLNIGSDIAAEAGLSREYEAGIEAGISFLVHSRKKYKVRSVDTFGHKTDRSKAIEGFQWDDGLFFSASFWELAQWRSKPYTVAMVMEALIKYRMGYQHLDCTVLTSPKLQLEYRFENDIPWSLHFCQ